MLQKNLAIRLAKAATDLWQKKPRILTIVKSEEKALEALKRLDFKGDSAILNSGCERPMKLTNLSDRFPEKHRAKEITEMNQQTSCDGTVDEMEKERIRQVREAMMSYQKQLKKKLIAQARKYHVPYDAENTNFSLLSDQLFEYRCNLKQAEEMGVYWDTSIYDPYGLRRIIQEKEREEFMHLQRLRSDYYATRL